ncbi:NADP(H)-dependent aldo-keto reductase [Rhizobacter sp. LjRoot28]|jgi:aryl-alcohol dehydrogenase-like predicted oxidoreductase|uniref:NADP(H)-dependent aldo-keto reductase n=1 Tax=Rhizobacter sp. LjRoot28 TaxID=3342309 RepID=UPI003ECDDD9F
MKYRPLGRTGRQVSVIGLGTMTWGQQNTEADAHAQLDAAIEAGVNFVDTAEMYPVPPRPETQGATERHIGTWLRQGGRRDKIVLATKAAGPSRTAQRPSHIRGGATSFTRQNLEHALNDSLARLQTDHVDLYQLHWPDRTTNTFGQRGYTHAPDEETVPIEETLEALAGLVQAGKVRHVGVSNETPWGLARFLQLAEARGLPRVASIQNAYNLVNRGFETGLSEFARRDDVGLLAYSPLAMGSLSGKYLAGARPPGARITLFDRFGRYKAEPVERATCAYVTLFRRHGLDPAQAALAFVNSRPFVTSTLIGATTLEQLAANIASVDLVLSDEVLAGIEAIQDRYPNPAS